MGQPADRDVHSSTLLPLGSIALAALLWAIGAGVARGLFDGGVSPIQLVQARAVITAAGLAVLPAARRRGSLGTVGMMRLVVPLGLALALVNATYYTAISRLAVAVAIVLQYLGPGLVVAWTAVAARRRPSGDVAVALVIAFCGVVLVSELPANGVGAVDVIGLVSGLASAVFFAAYTIQSERAAHAFGTIGAVFRGFAAASVVWILFQSPQGLPQTLFEAQNILGVLIVGVVGTLMPFLLYVWGVARLRAERAVIAATLEPLFASVVGWLWLGQILSLLQIAGGALILGGVSWLQLRSTPPARVPNEAKAAAARPLAP